MAKTPRQLDSRIEIVTPENIGFQYVLAGPFRRLPAFLIDMAIRAVVLGAMFLFCLLVAQLAVGGIGIGMFLVIWFAMSWFYGGFFETIWNGQTPGKWIMGLRVLSVDGQPINALQAVLRNVLREVDGMPMVGFGIPMYTLGLAAMTASDRFQRLGDLACGTIVIVEHRRSLGNLARVAEPEVIAFADRLPANFIASRGMSQALSMYVARRGLFSAARRHEIASILAEPLASRFGLPGGTDPDLLLRALYYRTFIAAEPRTPRERRSARIEELLAAEVASG
jgi:uncharacterized RDD family membrane protein YckC